MNQEQNSEDLKKLEEEAETVVSGVRETVSETVSEAEQLIETTAERAEERLEEAAEKIEEAEKKAEDLLAEETQEELPAEKAADGLQEIGEETAEQAEGITDAVTETAETAADELADLPEKISETAETPEEVPIPADQPEDAGSRPRVVYSNSKSEARKLAEKAGQAIGTAVADRESSVSGIRGLFTDPDSAVCGIVKPGNISFVIIAVIIACAARFLYRLIYMLHYNALSYYSGYSALRMIGEIPLSILYIAAETALLAVASWILFKVISGKQTDLTANLAAASLYPLVLSVYFTVAILQVLIPSTFVDIVLNILKSAATVYAIILVYKGLKCLADKEDKKVILITALSIAAAGFAADLIGLI